MANKEHWEGVYARKQVDQVSWYRPHLERSLEFVERSGMPRDAPIIDIGGGASTFVDDLLAKGYTDITVLDVAASAIDAAKRRLGPRASDVTWRVADVTEVDFGDKTFAFWHDRAVFHFMTDVEARRKYLATVKRAVRPGGYVLVGTFGPEGPEKCSGLDVARYTADQIHDAFGPAFQKVDSAVEIHTTPWGAEQQFVYCYCRLAGGGA